MKDRDFENFIDELLDNEFEYDDIVRVANSDDGIDEFDAGKILSDLCSMRYRFTFAYMAIGVINLIARPKKDHKTSLRHLKKASMLLDSIINCMERVHERLEKQKNKEGLEAEEEGGKSQGDEV